MYTLCTCRMRDINCFGTPNRIFSQRAHELIDITVWLFQFGEYLGKPEREIGVCDGDDGMRIATLECSVVDHVLPWMYAQQRSYFFIGIYDLERKAFYVGMVTLLGNIRNKPALTSG